MISSGFPQSHRLRKSSQFQSLSKNSNIFHGSSLFFVWKANALQHPRLGITVTKKFGDAHDRNRFKRLVREGFRLYLASKAFGVDIHVRSKNRGKIEHLPSFAEVCEDFARFFEKLAG